MKSAVISVGTELLFGQIVNTNAAYLSQELNNMGIDVLYHYTMGDNPQRFRRVMEFAMQDCDLFLITGGLGPTEDDLTKETLCEMLGEKLAVHQPTVEYMNAFFERVQMKMTENNMKQALVPEHAVVFLNQNGTAPGFAVEKEGKTFICMPGVPREMKKMFQDSVRPYLMRKADAYIISRSLRVFGIGESMVETMLLQFIDGQTDPTIATYAKEGEVEIRITSKRRRKQEAAEAVDQMARQVAEVMGDNVYSIEGKELYEETAEKLLRDNVTLALCETVTGGAVSSKLSRYPGISAVFNRALTVPEEEAQVDELSVPRRILDEYTSLSAEAAEAMSEGLHKKTGCRMCVSVTGNAGPDYCDGVEPGTFFISALYDGKMTTRRYYRDSRGMSLNIDFIALCVLHFINLLLQGKQPLRDLRNPFRIDSPEKDK